MIYICFNVGVCGFDGNSDVCPVCHLHVFLRHALQNASSTDTPPHADAGVDAEADEKGDSDLTLDQVATDLTCLGDEHGFATVIAVPQSGAEWNGRTRCANGPVRQRNPSPFHDERG